MKNFLIAYDVFDVKRLRKIRKIVTTYTLEGQKSVLEAPLDKALMKTLVSALLEYSKDEDKINIINVTSPILLGCAKLVSFENLGVIIT